MLGHVACHDLACCITSKHYPALLARLLCRVEGARAHTVLREVNVPRGLRVRDWRTWLNEDMNAASPLLALIKSTRTAVQFCEMYLGKVSCIY